MLINPFAAPHLFVDISSHGLGHLAQVGPILNALSLLTPDYRLTIRSALPRVRLGERITRDFSHIEEASDFGFVMHDATRINEVETAAKYQAWHHDWEHRVRHEARLLTQLGADLVLTDVAYLPLAGAKQAEIPALSMSSLNWADLFWHTFKQADWAPKIYAEILAAYRTAHHFIRLTPAMLMETLPNRISVAPVAAIGTHDRQRLCHQLGCEPKTRLVLIAFGGFDKSIAFEQWPTQKNIRWIVPDAWASKRTDTSPFSASHMPFTDLLASVDAVITKPGYGTFTEATCNGTAILYVPRENWPEQDCLIDWLNTHGRGAAINETHLQQGGAIDALHALWQQPQPPIPPATGALEAARQIAALLTQNYSSARG